MGYLNFPGFTGKGLLQQQWACVSQNLWWLEWCGHWFLYSMWTQSHSTDPRKVWGGNRGRMFTILHGSRRAAPLWLLQEGVAKKHMETQHFLTRQGYSSKLGHNTWEIGIEPLRSICVLHVWWVSSLLLCVSNWCGAGTAWIGCLLWDSTSVYTP